MSLKTYIVGTTQELHAAASTASGGDTIVLKPGTYKGIDLKNLSFDSTVKVISQDPDNPAVILDKLSLRNVENMHFDGLEFQLTELPQTGANTGFIALFYVEGGKDITLTNSDLTGLIADRNHGNHITHKADALIEGLPAGYGIFLRGAENVRIEENDLSTFYQGIGLMETENVTIARNYIHDMRSDGIVGSDQRNTLIEENLFANLHPYVQDPNNPNGYTDDHADFIQYWAVGSKWGIDGFYVRDNIFIQEEGFSQTIFGRLNLIGTEPEGVGFTDFEVSGNLIYNGHRHGITLGDVTGAKVFDNTLIANERVLGDHRDLPSIILSYDGAYAGREGFDINSENVQRTRDIDVYDNVGMQAYGEEVMIKAYEWKVDDLDEVKSTLDIRTWGNSWVSTAGITAESYGTLAKFDVRNVNGQKILEIDPDSEIIHVGAGSKYYYDTASLNTFLNNLGTDAVITARARDFATDTDPIPADRDTPPPAPEPAPEPETEAEENPAPVSEKPAPQDVNRPKVEETPAEPEPVAETPAPSVVAPKPAPEPAPTPKPAPVPGAESETPVTEKPVTEEPEPVIDVRPIMVPAVKPKLVDPTKVHPTEKTDTFDGMLNKVMDLRPGGSIEPVRPYSEPTSPTQKAVSEKPAEAASEEMMVVVLDGAVGDYDIYLDEQGMLSITDLASGVEDTADAINAVFFRADNSFYRIDAKTGTTELLDATTYKTAYYKLAEIGTVMHEAVSSARVQLGAEVSNDLLLGNEDTDFISGTAGKDIIVSQSSHAVVLGGPNVDTLVLEGRAEHYIHHVDAGTGLHKMFSVMTGEITEFRDVEQVYFEDSDQLHFVGQDSALPRMNPVTHAAEHARIESALWTYEDASAGF